MENQPQARFSQSSDETPPGRGAVEWTSEMVEAQPLSAVCAVFATVFLLGVVAVSALMEGKSRSRPKTRIQRISAQAEQIAEQVMEAVTSRLPKQLSGWGS